MVGGGIAGEHLDGRNRTVYGRPFLRDPASDRDLCRHALCSDPTLGGMGKTYRGDLLRRELHSSAILPTGDEVMNGKPMHE